MSQVFTFWSTLTPGTIFKNIFELAPGHYMKVSQGKKVIKPFWSLRFPVDKDACFRGTINEAAEELEKILTDAVRIRLRADVQVAAYLSGGLDSSATTALIKRWHLKHFRLSQSDLKTVNLMKRLTSRKFQSISERDTLHLPVWVRISATIFHRWYGTARYPYCELLRFQCSACLKRSEKTTLK